MKITLIKRERTNDDGAQFGKTRFVYYVHDHPAMQVCDYAIEGFLGIPAVPVGDSITLRVDRVPYPNLRVMDVNNEALLEELRDRLDKS